MISQTVLRFCSGRKSPEANLSLVCELSALIHT